MSPFKYHSIVNLSDDNKMRRITCFEGYESGYNVWMKD